MAAISSRQALTDYALRKLGSPVIEINVSEEQLSDRLDDALEWFQDFHTDGVERVYLKHQVVGTVIGIATANATTFTKGETVISTPSNVSFVIDSIPNDNQLVTRTLKGATFQLGETLTGQSSMSVATVNTVGSMPALPDVTIGDIENKFLPLSDAIIGIVQVLPLNQNFGGSNFNMFDVRYQIMLNDMFSLTNINMLYYTQVQSHLTMISFFLNPAITFQFNRHKNQLGLNVDWDQKINVGDFFVVEAFAILDPTQWTGIYNDRFLKEFYTALVKQQWGANLSKFAGMQLPGGVQINGIELYNSATADLERLEEKIRTDYELPPTIMIG